MILRKPYRILIKNFKLIHLILGIMSAYLLSKTLNLMNFFNEYQERTQTIISSGTSKQYFSGLLIVLSLLVFIGSITIFIIMRLKKKPILFYVITILAYLIMAAIYVYDNSIIRTLELNVLSMQTIKFAGDLTTISFIIQLFSTLMFFTRAIGFSLNKFNFDNDLKLDIDETDNEEFEFDLDYDSNNTKRSFNRMIRNLRYSYQENKIMYIIFSFLIIILIGAFIYLYINVFNKIYKENVTIKTGNYSLKIMDTYLVNTDYKNEKITDDYLVVVKMNIKDITGKNKVFETANMYLKINDVNYYPTNKYSNDLIDLGADYKEQKLSYEDKSYLFVFEIPESQINKKMMLYYSENGSYKIKLSPSKIKKGETKKTKLNSDMVINGGSFSNYKLNISSYEIAKRIKVSYRFCALTNKCSISYEYVVPSLSDNYDKVILRITSSTNNIIDFIEKYGTIKYTVNNEEKEMNNEIKSVSTTKVKMNNTYYFEINSDISDATNISLVFDIRNNKYEYVLK